MAKPWGWWTRHKLQILGDYLQAFATASNRLDQRIYLDLFAGWPKNVSRETDEPILGSVHRALSVQPPFTRVCLFELGAKARQLEEELRRAYPGRVTADNQTPLAMMLFGMINWTFTWLRPGGAMSYAQFAEEVIAMLERGLAG